MARPSKIYRKADLSADWVKAMSKPLQAEIVYSYILETKGAIDPQHPMSSKDIWNEYVLLLSQNTDIVDIKSENVNATYLSRLAADPRFIITCDGKKQGYYLDMISYNQSIGKPVQSKTKPPLEKTLYPRIKEWLEMTDSAFVVDSYNGKNGLWSNPDLLGITIKVALGVQQLDVVAVEVKNTIAGWQKNIFQAVAYLMMANRTYFAFLCTRQELDREKVDMIDYAQKNGIGLLAIIVNGKEYDVVPVHAAPYHNVDFKRLNDLLRRNGITDIHSLVQITSKNIQP